MSNNAPIFNRSLGFVSGAVFENGDGKRSISLRRSYKDKEDQWQRTPVLFPGDVANAIAIMNSILEFLTEPAPVGETQETDLEEPEEAQF